MEDPESPATTPVGSEEEEEEEDMEDSEASDIYGDLGSSPAMDAIASNSEDKEVDDADIFQELGMQVGEARRSPATRSSAAPTVCSDNRPELRLQGGRSKKDEVIKGSIIPTGNTDEGGEAEQGSESDAVGTRSQTRKVTRKQIADRISTESHPETKLSKDRGSSGSSTLTNIQQHLTSNPNMNKDLQFVLSCILPQGPAGGDAGKEDSMPQKPRSSARGKALPGAVECRGGRNEAVRSQSGCLLSEVMKAGKCKEGGAAGKTKSVRNRQSTVPETDSPARSTMLERVKSAVPRNESFGRGSVVERKRPEMSEISPAERGSVVERKHSEVSNNEPRGDSSTIIDRIISQARQSAGLGAVRDKGRKSESAQEMKKTWRKDAKSAQLDLFEDFLVGRDRDQLVEEIGQLKVEREKLHQELEGWTTRCSGLEKDNHTLLSNVSSLWKTALAQLRQKTAELAALRREKEAIIFRRALRQVPKDELDLLASRIAAYNKEEFAEFLKSLQDKEREECRCKWTPASGRTESFAQRIREAARGTRVSPSSDSEAQALATLLGRKGQTVTHSAEAPWRRRTQTVGEQSGSRGRRRDELTPTPKSQRCLFPREDTRQEARATRSIWDRLGKSGSDRKKVDRDATREEEDRRTDGRGEGSWRKGSREEEDRRKVSREDDDRRNVEMHEDERTAVGMDNNHMSDHGDPGRPKTGRVEKGKRKSIFSRLGTKRTIDNSEKDDVTGSSHRDSQAQESSLPKLERLQDQANLLTKSKEKDNLKQVMTRSERGRDKNVKLDEETPQEKKLLLNLNAPPSVQPIEEPCSVITCSTTTEDNNSGGSVYEKAASHVQQLRSAEDKSIYSEEEHEEMLSRTVFGQRMRAKMEKSKKPRSSITQRLNPSLTLPVSPEDTQGPPSKAPPPPSEEEVPHKALAPREEVPSHEEETPHKESAEQWRPETRTSSLPECHKELPFPGEDGLQNKGNAVKLSKKKNPINHSSADNQKGPPQDNDTLKKKHKSRKSEKAALDTNISPRRSSPRKTSKDINSIKKRGGKGVESRGDAKEVKKRGRLEKIEDSGGVESSTGGRRDKEDANGEQATKSSKETESVVGTGERITLVDGAHGADIDAEEINTAILSLAKLRSAFNGQHQTTRNSSRKTQSRSKHLISLMGEEFTGEDEAKGMWKEGQNLELLEEESESLEAAKKLQTGTKPEKNSCKDTSDNSYLASQEESLLPRNTGGAYPSYIKTGDRKHTQDEAEVKRSTAEKELQDSCEKGPRARISKRSRASQEKGNEKEMMKEVEGRGRSESVKLTSEESVGSGNLEADNEELQKLSRRTRHSRKHASEGDIDSKAEQNTKTRSEKRSSDTLHQRRRKTTTSDGKPRECQRSHKERKEKKTPIMPNIPAADKEHCKEATTAELTAMREGTYNSTIEPPSPQQEGRKSDVSSLTLGTERVAESSKDQDEENAPQREEALRYQSINLRGQSTEGLCEAGTSEAAQQHQSHHGFVATDHGGDGELDTELQNKAPTGSDDTTGREERLCGTDERKDADENEVVNPRATGETSGTSPASDDAIDHIDDNDNDILKSILSTNYDEESLFPHEDELLYDEDSEEEEDVEQDSSSQVRPERDRQTEGGGKPSGCSTERNVQGRENKLTQIAMQEDEEELAQERSKNSRTHSQLDRSKGTGSSRMTSSSVSFVEEREQSSSKTGTKSQKVTSAQSTKDKRDHTRAAAAAAVRKTSLTRDSSSPRAREESGSRSKSSSNSPSPRKESLAKHLGGRIKKLAPSCSGKVHQERNGVSPLMAREDRLQGKKVEGMELHQPSRGEVGTPRSRNKRKEKRDEPEESTRKRGEHSPLLQLSQNSGRSPLRMREGRSSARKAERASEAMVRRSKSRSPKSKSERSPPRRRKLEDEREEPISKRRRVSVKSRLTMLPHSDEENAVAWRGRNRSPSPEGERKSRFSCRLKNRLGERRDGSEPHLLNLAEREMNIARGCVPLRESPIKSIPVDSELLQRVLAQSPSKCMAQGDEKEEGELDDDEEEDGEERELQSEARGKNLKDRNNAKMTGVNKQISNAGSIDKQNLSMGGIDKHYNKKSSKDEHNVKESTVKQDGKVDGMDNLRGNAETVDKQNAKVRITTRARQDLNTGATADKQLSKIGATGTDDTKIGTTGKQVTKTGSRDRQATKIGATGMQEMKTGATDRQKGKGGITDKQHNSTESAQLHSRKGEGCKKLVARESQEKGNKRNCHPLDENTTFYPADLFQVVQAKLKTHPPHHHQADRSLSLTSAGSEDTIDLMVRQHNENFSSDITNASDDSEMSLLKYIADEEGDDSFQEEREERACSGEEGPTIKDSGSGEEEPRISCGGQKEVDLKKAQDKKVVEEKSIRTVGEEESRGSHLTLLGGAGEPTNSNCISSSAVSPSASGALRHPMSQGAHCELEDPSELHSSPDSTLGQVEDQHMPVKVSSGHEHLSLREREEMGGLTGQTNAYIVGSLDLALSPSEDEDEEELDIEKIDSSSEEEFGHTENVEKLSTEDNLQDLNIEKDSREQQEGSTEVTIDSTDYTESVLHPTPADDGSSCGSGDSDSDSDCECSDCNTSSSSSSSSSNSSSNSGSSSSSSSSDSEVDDTVTGEVESARRFSSFGEGCKEPVSQAAASAIKIFSHLTGEALTAVTQDADSSPRKPLHKTPKKSSNINRKTPRKSPHKIPKTSPSKRTPIKKSPKKTPCKKSPCKKSPLKNALYGKALYKRARKTPSVSPPTSLRAGDPHVISLSTSEESLPDLTQPSKGNKFSGPFPSQLSPTVASVQTRARSELQDQSKSEVVKIFHLQQVISPMPDKTSTTIDKNISPATESSTGPSMPMVEAVVVPCRSRLTSFGPSSSTSRTTRLSCTDTTNVISVVHDGQKDANQAPIRRTSSRTTKSTSSCKIPTTSPMREKLPIAKKRPRSPTGAQADVKNRAGKRMRVLSPAMCSSVSDSNSKSRSGAVSVAQSSSGSTSSSPSADAANIKCSVSTDIVVPVTIRRARRQLNLGLSSSPVTNISLGKRLPGPGAASQSGTPSPGSSTVLALRRSPRKKGQETP